MSVERLYKYGRMSEFSEALFTGSELYFSAADMLNDPYECTPNYTFVHDKDKIMDAIVRIILNQNPEKTRIAAEAEATEIYLRGAHRKPETYQGIAASLLNIARFKMGIYSMTETPSSNLMWAHYADEHKGYCLEFDVTEPDSIFIEAQQVRYSKFRPEINFFDASDTKHFNLTFLTKSEEWDYEKEWRIIGINGPGLYGYPPHLLKSVILGYRMSVEHKRQIYDWIQQRPAPVRLLQAVPSMEKFEIDIVET